MSIKASFTGGSTQVDFSNTKDFTLKIKSNYKEYKNNIEDVGLIAEQEYIYTGKGNFIQVNCNGVVTVYSTESGTYPVRGHVKKYDNNTVYSDYDVNTNYYFYPLSFQDINFGDDRNFSDFLNISQDIYNNWLSDRNISGISRATLNDGVIGKANYFSYALGNPPVNNEDLNRCEIDFEIESDIPIFFSYECASAFGFPSLKYDYVLTPKNVNWSIFPKANIGNYQSADYNGIREYALAYMIYDFDSYGKAPEPKPFFAEGVVTNIKYDGSKKASLIINHKFDLEEFLDLEETDIFKIPGYGINLAVNIQTVNPISGDSVNVYNLHKIDLPRDGFTKIKEVNDRGESIDFTYTYGDLVKACNNESLGLPMKISVSILQFAGSPNPVPYVIYENPINPNPDMNEVQHLGAVGSVTYNNTNLLTWNVYDGSDDGDNSSSDGKNDDKGDKSGGTGSGQGTHNVLTTTYVSNATRLQALGDFLWSSGFLDNILLVNNNPIENVISVKMFPFALPTGEESTIVLGNVNTEVPTNKLPDNYNYYHVYGSLSVPSYYNNFMDYAPYTRILLYLPFYGTLELDNSLVIDRTLKIAYIVDVVTGACTIDIYANDSLITVVSCQVGIDIPISSSNRAQVETAILTNTLTSAVSGASVGGGVGAVVGGVGGALMSAGHCKYNTQTSGTPSSATELYNVAVPMLIIDRPKYREIGGFAHNKGRMCMLTKKLSDVSGFSIFDENIDLSGVACTDTEQEIIRNLLKTGIYL